ncbi:MAG: type IV secretory system conjugative DNA transfer family protein [Caulobacteraceae bacterium]|jgi:type IV secretion system protein VirD4|nr:type IV secretory system conjugative DNA transfer family protein [Caulobacteraceae bacterium]MBX3428188.1 type IV secretory system conjugative DNA transfer family protein [Hyphomonadaceae bacterium]
MHEASALPKRHDLLLVLDEFPQLGAMPFFETAMGAMAGYRIKAYLVCQSLNHIIRAYGRDNVILDNCGIVTAFAAADGETAKRIAEMAGEVWELRESETHTRPKSFLGWRKGSTTIREERRPLLLPGDVRALPRDQQLIFVSGAKPIRAKKLKFDQEPIFRARLRPPTRATLKLTTSHDWEAVRALGRLPAEKKFAVRSERPKPTRARSQGDLFEAPMSISEQALAGFRQQTDQAPPPDASSKSRRARRTGV